MRNKSRIIRTLSTFTALAGIAMPLCVNAENSNPPAIELNFDVIEKLKHPQIDNSSVKPAPKKITKNNAKKPKKQKSHIKKSDHASKKPLVTKEASLQKKQIQATTKTPDIVKPALTEKPLAEIKKETAPNPVIVSEPQIEKKPAAEVSVVPEVIKNETAVKENTAIKQPAIEIKKDDQPEQAKAVHKAEESKPKDPLWKKIPFLAKPATKNEIIEHDISSAEKPVKEEQKEIYDDKHVEEFINEKSPGTEPVKGKAVNNIQSYAQSELIKQTVKESLERDKIKAKREVTENKIKASKPASVSSTLPEKDKQIVENPSPAAIEKPTEPLAVQSTIIKTAPDKDVAVQAEKTNLPTPIKQEPGSEPKEEQPIAKTIEKEADVADKNPEQSWQEFLAESKRKAEYLESAKSNKNPQEQINQDSVVALKPENKANDTDVKNDSQSSPEQNNVSETSKTIESTKAEVVPPTPAPPLDAKEKAPEAKPEEELKFVESKKLETPVIAQTKTAVPAKETDPKQAVNTNGSITSPVIEKQDKATLSSVLSKLPYFNENKNELKNDALKQKSAEVKVKEPQIPPIHEVKPIAVEISHENEKPLQETNTEEKLSSNMGVLNKILDKKLTPTTLPPPPEKEVVISQNTDKKLNEAIDEKIVAMKEISPTAPVTDTKTPVQILPLPAAPKQADDITDQPEKEVIKNGDETLLTIVFDSNTIVLNDADKERLANFVAGILNSNKRFKIISYAQGIDGEINSARRISLQRAIAVRAKMIESGLGKNRINVQAVGNNPGNQELANSVNIYEIK